MNPAKLLPNEKILMESSSRGLVLTTHRIRFTTEIAGRHTIKSIMLEELASCSMVKASQPPLLFLAALSFLIGLLLTAANRSEVSSEVSFFGGIGLGVVFLLIYFAGRKLILSFASAGTTIVVNAGGMKFEDAREFIDRTEAAKNTRYMLLAK